MRTRHHVKYYADSSRLHKNYKRSTENVLQKQTGIPPSKKENKKIWRLRLALAPFRSKLAPYCHVFRITSYHLRTTIKTKWKLNSHYQLIVSCRLWRRFLCRQNYITVPSKEVRRPRRRRREDSNTHEDHRIRWKLLYNTLFTKFNGKKKPH